MMPAALENSGTVSQNEIYTRVGEMAQQVRELVVKPDDLALMPRTHIIEGKNQF